MPDVTATVCEGGTVSTLMVVDDVPLFPAASADRTLTVDAPSVRVRLFPAVQVAPPFKLYSIVETPLVASVAEMARLTVDVYQLFEPDVPVGTTVIAGGVLSIFTVCELIAEDRPALSVVRKSTTWVPSVETVALAPVAQLPPSTRDCTKATPLVASLGEAVRVTAET